MAFGTESQAKRSDEDEDRSPSPEETAAAATAPPSSLWGSIGARAFIVAAFGLLLVVVLAITPTFVLSRNDSDEGNSSNTNNSTNNTETNRQSALLEMELYGMTPDQEFDKQVFESVCGSFFADESMRTADIDIENVTCHIVEARRLRRTSTTSSARLLQAEPGSVQEEDVFRIVQVILSGDVPSSFSLTNFQGLLRVILEVGGENLVTQLVQASPLFATLIVIQVEVVEDWESEGEAFTVSENPSSTKAPSTGPSTTKAPIEPSTAMAPTGSPARAPTRSPSPVTMSPTMAPTEWDPLTIVGTWVQKFPPLAGPMDSQFGFSVGLDANYMAVGSPNFEQRGSVFSSVYDDFEGSWVIRPTLFGEDIGDNFGAALDLVNERMVVGAPTKLLDGTLVPGGAAYVYSFNAENNRWDQFGSNLQGDADILAAGGEFGASVSLGIVADGLTPRVVVGAPKVSTTSDSFEVGKVYTFEAIGDTWSSLDVEPLTGKESYDWFGAVVDLSTDGSRLIVGAPGRGGTAGYFRIYEWDGSAWSMEYEEAGTGAENFGSAVTSFTKDVFAVGGPGYQNSAGRVVLYQQQSAGSYAKIGEIIGEVGDAIGKPHTVSGGLHDDGLHIESIAGDEVITVVVAKANGAIDSCGYDMHRDVWAPRIETLETGMEDLVINYSIKNGIMWGSTSANEVSVLEFSACNPETENWCAFGCNPEEARCAWHPSDRRL